MAPNKPRGLNRRQLLGSAAGVAVSSIAPAGEGVPKLNAEVDGSQAIQPLAVNVCSGTARRIAQIAARNLIREEAGLPLLSIPKELRRMKEAEDAANFEAFAAAYRSAVWDEILAPVRQAKGNPNWRPTSFMQGLAYQAQVSRILRHRFAPKPHEAALLFCCPRPSLRNDADAPRAAISRSD
jgi:hypothetical protein